MSRKAYELLREVELLDSQNKPAELAELDEPVLLEKLHFYHDSRSKAATAEVQAERVGRKELAALRSSISCSGHVDRLLNSALVYHRFFVDDPLFRMAQPTNDYSRACNSYLGFGERQPIDRKQLAQGLQFFSSIHSLVTAGLCTLLPLGHQRSASDKVPIFASDDLFFSCVPESVRHFVHEAAVLREVAPFEGNGYAILDRPPQEPTRGIQIEFSGDRLARPPMFFFLFDVVDIIDLEDGRQQVIQTLDWNKKPSVEYYNAWVTQSVNRAVCNRLSAIGSELHLADKLNATYVTESQFESRLLGVDSEDGPRSMRSDAVNFLTANAPFLGAASAEAVASIRQDNTALFEKFQASLLHVSSQLAGVDADYEEKARALYVKEIEPQIRDINSQWSKVKWLGASSGGLATAATISFAITKAAAIPFSIPLALTFAGASLLQGVSGMLPAIGEYRQKQQGPAFIWSRLAKS